MSSLTMRDCLVYPYGNFKEKIKISKEVIPREMKKMFGKKFYEVIDLDTCFLVEYKSPREYF
jgi:hypothetical protein